MIPPMGGRTINLGGGRTTLQVSTSWNDTYLYMDDSDHEAIRKCSHVRVGSTMRLRTRGKTNIEQIMCLIERAVVLGRRLRFSAHCACVEAATEGGKAVYVNRKQFEGESLLIY